MGKTCLNGLTAGFATTCALPVHGIKELYLIQVSDVIAINKASNGVWTGITFVSGAKSYRVEGYKQNIQVTASTRSTDASNKFDVSVMFKVPYSVDSSLRSLLMGRFYILAIPNDIRYDATMLGDSSPLEMTGADWDSNANGQLMTVTMSAPEGSSGGYLIPVGPGIVTSIKSIAI